jgi:large subunit ribosomal protein L25
MEKHKLQAEKRKVLGRKVKKIRKEGVLPANIYGKGVKSLSIQLPVKNFLKVYEEAGETGIIELSVDEEKYPVLVHNLQLHPVTSQPLHVDFHHISLTEKVKATVPLVTIGEAPAVAQKLGLLLTPISEIEVEALPGDLPEKIELDISLLKEVGQELKVSDLKVNEKVIILADPNLVVVKIGELVTEEAKKILEEEKAAAEAASAEAAAEKGEAPPAEGAPPAGEAAGVPEAAPPEEKAPASGAAEQKPAQAPVKPTEEKK